MSPLKFFILINILFIIAVGSVAWYVSDVVSEGMPSLEQLENPKQNLATQVISADGELLDHFFIQKRINLPFDSIPKDFINALIAVEDREFYNHWGVHTTRIFKAAIKNLLAGRAKEGASTITMQLARNLFLNKEATFTRKIREAFTAIQIEKTYTKKEIIVMYANTVPFGRGAYGIQVASYVYFNKPPLELTTSECAFLVGILKAPEHYNGIVDYQRAIYRRNLVLHLMSEQGLVTDNELVDAMEEPITLATGNFQTRKTYLAPHFVEMIRQQLNRDERLKEFDLYRDGLIIYTTLNSRIQKYANEAVEEHLAEFQRTFNRSWSWQNNQPLLTELLKQAIHNRADYTSASRAKRVEIEYDLMRERHFIDSVKNAATTVQVGLVVIEPATGKILAMVGGSPKFMKEHPDAKYSLNHTTQIKRQPGSSFKPFVYSSALLMGLTVESQIGCGPYTYKLSTGEIWSPRGSGSCGEGQTVSLAQGLKHSINTVSARLITQVTTPFKVVELVKRMGITTDLLAVPALALGAGGDVIPIELTSAFGTFLNQGIHVNSYAVNRIEDQFGNSLFQKTKSIEATDVISRKIANEITYMLQGVVQGGTGWKVRDYFNGVEAAGKTGTTNDYADAWFVGYTPELVAGVWVGFDDRRITFTGGYGYASSAAAPIWGRLMSKIYNDERLPFKKKEFTFALDSLDSLEQRDIFRMKSAGTQISNYQEDNDIYDSRQNNKQNNNEQSNNNEQTRQGRLPKLPKPEKPK